MGQDAVVAGRMKQPKTRLYVRRFSRYYFLTSSQIPAHGSQYFQKGNAFLSGSNPTYFNSRGAAIKAGRKQGFAISEAL